MLLRFTLALLTRSLGWGMVVTVGRNNTGLGTGKHTIWELPKGRHRHTNTVNQEHYTQ